MLNMGRIINIGKIYSIQDLNTPSQKLHSNYRDRVKIVVIDDEDFIYFDDLRRSGFNITQYHDIEDLQTLDAFHVIICDIKGIGRHFNSRAEGAFIIRELKKKHPYKVFAAYTGSTHRIDINEYLLGVHIIKKDIDMDDWCNEIDSLVRKAVSPQYVWTAIREILLNENVSTLSIARLEHKYVDIILNKNGDFTDLLTDKKIKISDNVKDIITTLISNIALGFLFK
jgi:hypothetical protein